MSEKVANIAKNTSYFTIALILQKVVSFTYFTIIARALLPEELGRYYFAISFTSIFGILIDIGLANYLTREVARPDSVVNNNDGSIEAKKSRSGRWLGAVMAIKIPTSIISLLIVIASINFLNYPVSTRELVYLSSICMILDSFTLTLFSVVRGFHNLLYESIASIIFQLIVLLTGITVLYFKLGLLWLMVALVAASTFNFIYSSILVKYKFKLNIHPIFDKDLIKKIIIISVPFALYGIFQRFYTYFDSVLLTTIAGERYNGIYQISFKIINALQFLPLAFTATLYPAFSSYWHNNKEQLSITFERAMNYLVAISLPIIFGVVILADKIVELFKAKYSDAMLPLQITIVSVLFSFLAFPVGSLLNASDNQKKNTQYMAIVMFVSIAMNLVLIPKFNVVGASITVLATNMLMFLLGIIKVNRILDYKKKKVVIFSLKIIIACVLMGIATYLLKEKINIFINVIISAFIFVFFTLLSGAIKKADLASILQSFDRKK